MQGHDWLSKTKRRERAKKKAEAKRAQKKAKKSPAQSGNDRNQQDSLAWEKTPEQTEQLVLETPLTCEFVDKAKNAVLSAIESGQEGIVLNLSGATEIDGAGLAFLAQCENHCRQLGRSFSVVEISENGLELCRATGLADSLTILEGK